MTNTHTNTLKLYFICADNEDGDNVDALVWARSRDEAVKLYLPIWQQTNLPTGSQVFEVPLSPPAEPYVLKWHTDICEAAE